jgi:hypothetical protein
MWNAGYNPYSATNSLQQYSDYYNGRFISLISQTFFGDGHGTTKQRVDRIKRFLSDARLNSNYIPNTSLDLVSARAEFHRLNKSEDNK